MVTTLLNNRYQAIQVIGDGGFGKTFLAEDTYLPSRRRCVIKQLKPVIDNPQMYQMVQERFQREAATLEHLGEGSDQIPKLYAYFSEDGLFYLVQEWIQGPTLTQKVEAEGPQSETTVSQILVSLLPVLDYVHSKRIIHRDVKPDNIILRQSNSKPVLIDFGAVKETMGTVVNAPNVNQSLVVGTPGFMSPEQAVGRPVYASDLYGLALTAIYLLTGKQPQELPTDPQTGKILWQQQAVNISSNLAAVLDRAIQPYAGDRYTTAQKMLNDLQHAAISSPPPATGVATVAVSPKAVRIPQPPQPGSSPQPAAVINSPQHQRQKAIIVGVLAAVLSAVAVVVVRHQSDPTPVSTLPSSQPSPQSSAASTPSEPPIASVPVTIPSVGTQVPSPPATSPQDSESPTAQTPPATSPPGQDNGQDNSPNKTSTAPSSVQTFPTGTARTTVEAALGKPDNDSRGAWGHTRAVLYKNAVPDQVDLGYLYDRSGRIRETEAGFAPTADPQIVSTTLNRMLDGGATEEIKQGLQQVQQGGKNYYTFTQNSLKGMIVRQSCKSIYISIWDADLHDFDPGGAQQCS